MNANDRCWAQWHLISMGLRALNRNIIWQDSHGQGMINYEAGPRQAEILIHELGRRRQASRSTGCEFAPNSARPYHFRRSRIVVYRIGSAKTRKAGQERYTGVGESTGVMCEVGRQHGDSTGRVGMGDRARPHWPIS